MTEQAKGIGLTRDAMARRVALDIRDGAYVNLGIGIPELVAKYVPEGREVIYHTENGLLGMGPAPQPGQGEPELINAGKRQVTANPGAAYFHHADSFAMIRGGHIDVCVLGALQVAANGDLRGERHQCGSHGHSGGGAVLGRRSRGNVHVNLIAR